MYNKEGIDTRYILEDPEVPTGLASILVEENGKNRIIVYPGANMTMTPEDVEEPFICCPDALYMQLEVPYNGETKVLHYLEVLRDVVSFENLKKIIPIKIADIIVEK